MSEPADEAQRDPQSYAVIGAAMQVHCTLGNGFLEAVYQEAMALELAGVGIPFEREAALPIQYRGVTLGTVYRADFVCFETLLVEPKARLRCGRSVLFIALKKARSSPSRRAQGMASTFSRHENNLCNLRNLWTTPFFLHQDDIP